MLPLEPLAGWETVQTLNFHCTMSSKRESSFRKTHRVPNHINHLSFSIFTFNFVSLLQHWQPCLFNAAFWLAVFGSFSLPLPLTTSNFLPVLLSQVQPFFQPAIVRLRTRSQPIRHLLHSKFKRIVRLLVPDRALEQSTSGTLPRRISKFGNPNFRIRAQNDNPSSNLPRN